MLRIIQNTNAAGAKGYYSTADYYSEGQELVGHWRGEGAKRLGLWGKIQQDAWDALCDNRDPASGKALTARQKETRRVGYDFNFHCPKSLSILYGVTQDERLLDAFRASVDETMRDMEAEMKTRVRRSGRNEDRLTGNMVWGEFVHFTARPVDGIPDPHLHAHCFVFNTTWDKQESRWKAGQFADLKRDAPYFEALFHSRLARRMAELGLPVERTKKGWELAGIAASTIDRFSRRTTLIEEKARQAGITDDRDKDGIGAMTRERKAKNLTLDELREEWQSRLTPDESGSVETLRCRLGSARIAADKAAAGEAVRRAIDHCFERNSVLPERKALREALRWSVGLASPEAVQNLVTREHLITGDLDRRRYVTTRAVLAEEKRMIEFAREGRGSCPRLGDASYVIKRDWLNDGQRQAVLHVLNSHDRVMLIRGAAGVGKTAAMQEAVEAIEARGKRVFAFAPSADASRGVLRNEGFENAETVARLLTDEALQAEIESQVIWIDEAGQLGSRAMAQLFDLALRKNARIILSGDRRQHGSVERGAVLRLLETQAGLVPAEIKDIQRQKGNYKQAVRSLSEGRTQDGFRMLNKLGWIREVAGEERYKALAADYVDSVLEGKSALVVSPTHAEGDRITHEIRLRLIEAGRLKNDERTLRVLSNANLTEAERRDRFNYLPGDVLVFHQNAKGHAKGERIAFGGGTIPSSEAARFQVFHPQCLAVASGDVLRVTRNGFTADGKHRLNNGGLYTVSGFNRDGDIVLSNGWIVGKDFGHLAHGYVVTSHASQGKTVDRVFIGQSSQSLPASSREQFYVSVSRGKEQATIYTDDKHGLLEAIERSDERLAATDLLTKRTRIAVLNRGSYRPALIGTASNRNRDCEVIHDR